MSLDPTMEHQIGRMVDDLCSEFAGQFERPQLEQVMSDSVERVLTTAKVFDFVPLMAYRFTRERLDAILRSRGDDAEGSLGCRVRQPQRRWTRTHRIGADDHAV